MKKYYIYEKNLTDEEIIEIYKKKIKVSSIYQKEINEQVITIAKGFLIYPFIEAKINALDYLVIKNQKESSGRINVSSTYIDKNFIINDLNTKLFSEKILYLDELNIFNSSEIAASEKKFVSKLVDKATSIICERHNLILTDKENDIDIAPIRNFDEINYSYYLEEVYLISYFDNHKKTYKSMYSSYLEGFYYFDYLKSPEFLFFYKKFKRPIVYLPKEYYEEYYDYVFNVYLRVTEELKYLKNSELFLKLKKNAKYKEYSKHRDYLEELIFYYKRKNYLKDYSFPTTNYKSKIINAYLTLNYQGESGLFLAELVQQNVLEGNYVKLLATSANLGNNVARKNLVKYYNHPRNFNQSLVKKYS